MGSATGSDGETRAEDVVGWHVRRAHATLKGEHQLAQYVARLGPGECAAILVAVPEGLPQLARLRDECRVGPRETRSFEAVIRTWTLCVLSGAEGG